MTTVCQLRQYFYQHNGFKPMHDIDHEAVLTCANMATEVANWSDIELDLDCLIYIMLHYLTIFYDLQLVGNKYTIGVLQIKDTSKVVKQKSIGDLNISYDTTANQNGAGEADDYLKRILSTTPWGKMAWLRIMAIYQKNNRTIPALWLDL